ncbi:NusG domain II-containing protein [Catenibacterium faecis]
MISATCPDHLCIKQGTINKKGQSIICLPHKLIVEVVSGDEKQQDDQAY